MSFIEAKMSRYKVNESRQLSAQDITSDLITTTISSITESLPDDNNELSR